jgi:hypothetical protein
LHIARPSDSACYFGARSEVKAFHCVKNIPKS